MISAFMTLDAERRFLPYHDHPLRDEWCKGKGTIAGRITRKERETDLTLSNESTYTIRQLVHTLKEARSDLVVIGGLRTFVGFLPFIEQFRILIYNVAPPVELPKANFFEHTHWYLETIDEIPNARLHIYCRRKTSTRFSQV